MARSAIRDFIYLDIERVRSFVAQVYGGLPSERTSLSEHQTGGQGEIRGGIPLMGQASGGADYHYLRSHSETRSLHDHIFEELAAKLEFKDLTYINSSEWTEAFFKDGSFIKTRGLLKIVDYQSIKLDMDALPKMIDTFAKIFSKGGGGGKSPVSSSGKVANPAISAIDAGEIRSLQEQFKALPLQELARFIDQLYGDVIKIKIFPFFEENPDRVLIGGADRILFRYPPRTLINWYGPTIDAGWVSILQINRGQHYQTGKFSSNTGNKLEDGLEQLADHLSNIGTVAQGVTFPSVAVTPIAIYREV